MCATTSAQSAWSDHTPAIFKPNTHAQDNIMTPHEPRAKRSNYLQCKLIQT